MFLKGIVTAQKRQKLREYSADGFYEFLSVVTYPAGHLPAFRSIITGGVCHVSLKAAGVVAFKVKT